MPATGLPIICQRCGFRWNDGDRGAAVFGFDNAIGITLANVRTNCPRCGTMTTLADGTYNIREGQWHLVRRLAADLKSAQATPDDYARLLSLVRQAQITGQGAEQVANDIAAQTPFARLAETIRAHPPGWTAYILAAILAVVLWLIPPPDKNAATHHQMS